MQTLKSVYTIYFTLSNLNTHIINNLTEDYETLIDILGRRIGTKTDPSTVEDLRQELGLRYECLKMRKEESLSKNDNNEEHAMFAGGKFKGKCNHCGTYGHKSTDCWVRDPSKKPKGSRGGSSNSTVSTMTNTTNNNNNNRKQKFNGECFYCKKFGH